MPWTEADTAAYRSMGDVAVPRRHEVMTALVSLVPFESDAIFRIVEIGAGDGMLAAALLEKFPRATYLGLDGSSSMREALIARTTGSGERVRVRPFELAQLDWWDLMRGAGLVVSSLCFHHLTDTKRQYLYKAVAERLAPGGALLIADIVAPPPGPAERLAADMWDAAAKAQADASHQPEKYAAFLDAKWNHFRFPDPSDHPSPLLHELVWLKHAGFESVDCFWMFAGHAVFGGFRQGQAFSGVSAG